MARLLLHVGLPKTATTSLQNNVLLRLHAARRINFLGRSAGGDDVFDPFEPVWRAAIRDRTGREIDALRPAVDASLDDTRLNVFSREGLFNAQFPGGEAARRVRNMRRLLRGIDVKVLVTLRSPVEYVYAAYVEGYSSRFCAMPRYDTFDKFTDHLARSRERHREEIAFFLDGYLRTVGRGFNDIEVLLYEDLRHDPPCYFGRLAACLDADPAEIERMFHAVQQNRGTYTETGKLSRPVPALQFVRNRLKQHVPGYAELARRAKRIPLVAPLYGRLQRITRRVAHPCPDEATRDRLQRVLGLRDDYLTRMHGVSAEKLAHYGYLHPEHERAVTATQPRAT